MTDTDRSIVNDYETTIDRLREAKSTLLTELDSLVDECDRLRAENKTLRYQVDTTTENSKSLLQTIDLLRSENARLKVALQTGEQ
jgi:regulator of replication initiation timing